mmetsp:Transcript_28494/g.98388  ORF Transcript_28494/g.98388 Transcript_28494/m.98388 type:complete len:263 (-) Transcript_28494:197-985(-)
MVRNSAGDSTAACGARMRSSAPRNSWTNGLNPSLSANSASVSSYLTIADAPSITPSALRRRGDSDAHSFVMPVCSRFLKSLRTVSSSAMHDASLALSSSSSNTRRTSSSSVAFTVATLSAAASTLLTDRHQNAASALMVELMPPLPSPSTLWSTPPGPADPSDTVDRSIADAPSADADDVLTASSLPSTIGHCSASASINPSYCASRVKSSVRSLLRPIWPTRISSSTYSRCDSTAHTWFTTEHAQSLSPVATARRAHLRST